MSSYSPTDVGGGWVIEAASNIDSGACALDEPIELGDTIISPVCIGLGLLGVVLGAAAMYVMKGGKK